MRILNYSSLLNLSFFFTPALSPVAVLLKDDYFVRGAGLPGRFKAEKMEFHWGQSNGSSGSEHSINGRRFPVEVKFPVSTTHNNKCAVWGSLNARESMSHYNVKIHIKIVRKEQNGTR